MMPRSSVLLFAMLGAACSDSATATPAADAARAADGPAADGGTGGAAPGDGGAPDAGDPSIAAFAPDRVIEVAVTMAPADWDTLRNQKNDSLALLGPTCQAGPPRRAFTELPADVTLDGEAVPRVAIRKKGYLGSLSVVKPSLKIDLDATMPGREWRGLERLTLNNNKQDAALLRTCVTFGLFRGAGIPASRCNFAHVTVNGQDLGVYSHVEGVSPRMLRRWFPDGSGSLYEGSISDVRRGWSATYEQKNDLLLADRSDLEALVAALDQTTDAELVDRVSTLVDLDAFLKEWAAEALFGHWDGYSNNANNHFLYREPTSGKWHVLPWGPDLSLTDVDPFTPKPRPASVSANTQLARRLYAIPAIKARYVAAMRALLAGPWSEAAIEAELDRVAALLAPFVPDRAAHVAEVEAVRAFVRGRRAQVMPELEAGGAAWDKPPVASPCFSVGGSVRGSFQTTWGTLAQSSPFGPGMATLDVTLGAMTEMAAAAGAGAGSDTSSGLGPRATIQVVGASAGGNIRAVALYVEPTLFAPGATLPFDWQSVLGILVRIEGSDPVIDGLLDGGMLHLDMATPMDGASLSGTFEAPVLRK